MSNLESKHILYSKVFYPGGTTVYCENEQFLDYLQLAVEQQAITINCIYRLETALQALKADKK